MWIFANQGFVSAVCPRQRNGSIDKKHLVVRARSVIHLKQLLETCGLSPLTKGILHTPALTTVTA